MEVVLTVLHFRFVGAAVVSLLLCFLLMLQKNHCWMFLVLLVNLNHLQCHHLHLNYHEEEEQLQNLEGQLWWRGRCGAGGA